MVPLRETGGPVDNETSSKLERTEDLQKKFDQLYDPKRMQKKLETDVKMVSINTLIF